MDKPTETMPNPYDIKNVLALNVEALMAYHADFSSNLMVEKNSGGSIKKSTLQRIRAKKTACDISTLARLASVFGLTPWQLLVPRLDPKNPQSLRELTPTEMALYAKFEEILVIAKEEKAK